MGIEIFEGMGMEMLDIVPPPPWARKEHGDAALILGTTSNATHNQLDTFSCS